MARPLDLFLMVIIIVGINALALRSSATSTSLLGVNYGLVADDLPSPSTAAALLASIGVGRVRLYDANRTALASLAAAGFEIVVGVPDNFIPKLSDPAAALSWIRSNLLPHLPAAKIAAVTVGNEVLTGNDTSRIASLVPAMKSLRSSLDSAGLSSVSVTTAHNLAVLDHSYPPSSGRFRSDLLPYILPLLDFLSDSNSPFFINAYPYFAYRDNPKTVPLSYALGEPNSGVIDAGSGLRYENMITAQVDAVYAAISAARGGKKAGVEVRVSETGWPSAGDDDELAATVENAAKYNGNLIRLVASGNGTPARPGNPLRVYVFALFNENLKPGPASERNYGLFRHDGSPAYALNVSRHQQDISPSIYVAGGRVAAPIAGPSPIYNVSSAAMRREQWRSQMALVVLAAAAMMVQLPGKSRSFVAP